MSFFFSFSFSLSLAWILLDTDWIINPVVTTQQQRENPILNRSCVHSKAISEVTLASKHVSSIAAYKSAEVIILISSLTTTVIAAIPNACVKFL